MKGVVIGINVYDYDDGIKEIVLTISKKESTMYSMYESVYN